MGKRQEETQTLCLVKRQMKQSFEALCPSGDLTRRKPQGPQTTSQQSLIDINVVNQELPKGTAKIGQIPPEVKGLKQTDASKNFKAFCFSPACAPCNRRAVRRDSRLAL